MANKSQFMKNNNLKVASGSGGTMDSGAGLSKSRNVGSVSPHTLGHGNSHTAKMNNKGSRSKFASGR